MKVYVRCGNFGDIVDASSRPLAIKKAIKRMCLIHILTGKLFQLSTDVMTSEIGFDTKDSQVTWYDLGMILSKFYSHLNEFNPVKNALINLTSRPATTGLTYHQFTINSDFPEWYNSEAWQVLEETSDEFDGGLDFGGFDTGLG